MRSPTKKLSLAKQTLRSLSAGELGEVQGGEIVVIAQTVINKPTSTGNDPLNTFCQIVSLDLPKAPVGGIR